jgi:AIPR protein
LTEKDQIATLINPSVVNGAQTLYAISASSKKRSPALVTTRVVVRGDQHSGAIEDDEWLQGVIRGVNTQNRVHSYDFRSNEPEQIELQSRFRDLKVFYERKRGEWRESRNEPRYRNFDRLSLRTMGFILATASDRDGSGVLLVKRGAETIFEERHYRQLFPSRGKIGRRFDKIYLAYRIFRLLRYFGYRDAKESRKERHAFWNTLWILHASLTSDPQLQRRLDVRKLRDVFDTFEGNGMSGRNAKKLLKQTRRAVWGVWRKSRTADPERLTAANFFKSKAGNRKILSLAFPRLRKELRLLAERIASEA